MVVLWRKLKHSRATEPASGVVVTILNRVFIEGLKSTLNYEKSMRDVK